jgi:beta-xylosidase
MDINPHGGDNNDGTYNNFILFSDYADPDVIRVGDDFYMVTSTFHFCPAITVLHSRDLVNWTIITHVLDDISKLHPDFSFSAMRGYSHGIWAPSLRYHEGTFFVHVGGPKIGLIVCKSDNINGPWTVKRMKLHQPWKGNKLIDCCPFWDDDGQAYLAATEPRWFDTPAGRLGDYRMYLFKMHPNGEELLDNGTVIHGGKTTEAAKIYKIGGCYYTLYTENAVDENTLRTQFAARSRSVYGPYERRKLIHSHGAETDMLPSQGGLVEAGGKWWYLCHGMYSGSPYFALGRPVMLLPVEWTDGWPIIGKDADNDGLGEIVWRHEKPISGQPQTFPASNDEFSDETLGSQWQWNHQPRNDSWSLSARKGSLRLTACKPVYPGGFYAACNTLTQRIIGTHGTAATLLSTDSMTNGQYAGLCFMTGVSQLIGVYMEGGKKYIRYQYTNRTRVREDDGTSYCDDFYCSDLSEYEGDKIHLKLEHCGETAQLFYSTDGNTFTPAHAPKPFSFHAWRGGRIGVFSWNDFTDGGNADFDWFRYVIQKGDNQC